MTTPGLVKIKTIQNKGYNVIIVDDDVNNKILMRDSRYLVYVIMWPKSGNSSSSIREVIITSILEGFDQENQLFWGVALVQAQ